MNAIVIPIKRAHALCSPSSAKKWITCPGSLAQEKDCPEDEGNEFSEEGTCAHGVASMCLTEKRPALAYVGRRIDVGPHKTREFEEDMAEPVQTYVDLVNALVASTNGQLFVEQEVPIDHITGEEDATGTADTVIVTGDGEEIIGVDLKFGRGVRVSAEKNEQLMMYALGTLALLELVIDVSKVKRFRMMISQPRVTETPSEDVISIEDLKAFGHVASIAAGQALDLYNGPAASGVEQGAPVALRPSTEGCQWCRAKATCPALATFVYDTIGAGFEVLAEAVTPPAATEKARTAQAKAAAPKFLPGEDPALLSAKMAAADLIEEWLKAIRGRVEILLLNGVAVPGYKLVQGRKGNRAWSDDDDAETLLKSFRLKSEEMYTRKVISPTKAEEVLKGQPKRWAKVEPLITRADGSISVAHVSDKRDAIVKAPPADAFDVVEEAGAEDLI